MVFLSKLDVIVDTFLSAGEMSGPLPCNSFSSFLLNSSEISSHADTALRIYNGYMGEGITGNVYFN